MVYIFPIWKPSKMTKFWIHEGLDKKKAFKAFRASSSGFIAKKTVRDIVLKKFDNKCSNCGSVDNLQIDHIISVHRCFHYNLLNLCNDEANLQVLCSTCNYKKS